MSAGWERPTSTRRRGAPRATRCPAPGSWWRPKQPVTATAQPMLNPPGGRPASVSSLPGVPGLVAGRAVHRELRLRRPRRVRGVPVRSAGRRPQRGGDAQRRGQDRRHRGPGDAVREALRRRPRREAHPPAAADRALAAGRDVRRRHRHPDPAGRHLAPVPRGPLAAAGVRHDRHGLLRRPAARHPVRQPGAGRDAGTAHPARARHVPAADRPDRRGSGAGRGRRGVS